MIAYFDSSALVKLVIEEHGSDAAAALWDGADAVLSSRVAHAEVRAALAAAHRAARLTTEQNEGARRLWGQLWSALRLVEVSQGVGQRAGDIAEEHALSGFDAIHLASALLVDADGLIVATWDTRLATAAMAVGVPTLPDRS
ncbi:PIN domain-containing protein [Egibacter rhizosphaerae]|uniref:Ribonuclease VapC n=1 Tax=Egibacter rhizosphaerae TaxID=1670831 RepID=A0A411YEX6_9ACTN|nr:type II toxin-antitoxin system VapC family toxin [Egibacter rhizosphaerae]QBI19672.1 PIN domain-containing protein [Egibacter rhizosphaerae]